MGDRDASRVARILDRRAFLTALGGAGAALISGCGGSAASGTFPGVTGSHASAARPPSPVTPPPPHKVGPPVPRTLRAAIRGPVLRPGDAGFAAAARVFNPRFDGVRPNAVARPLDTKDVAAAVRFAVAREQPLRARSGGHSYAGYSTQRGGIVLDLRRLRGISVDRGAGTATVGAGAQLIDVYATLAAHGATIPGGSCPSVGISGVTLGGGFGLAGRAFGLTADHLQAAEIVTADGRARTVDARHDPDLLWALRGGGGGNFGVVTAFTFRVRRLPRTGSSYFSVSWPWGSAAEAIAAWQAWAPHTMAAITSVLHVNGGGAPSITASGQYLGSSANLRGLLGSLMSVPGAQLDAGDLPYLALQQRWAGCEGERLAACHTVGTEAGGTMPRISFTAKSDYVARPLPAAGIAAVIAAAEAQTGSAGALLCDAYGGAIGHVDPSATAFVHRDQLFCIQYYGNGASPEWPEQAWRKLRPYVSGQAYQNYIDASLHGWQRAYYGANYGRLEQVRRTVDPEHFFRFPQAIGA